LNKWSVVSTQLYCVSTLVHCPRTKSSVSTQWCRHSLVVCRHWFQIPGDCFCDIWDRVSTHRVKCVDTVPGSVDTRPSFQKTLFGQLGQCVDTLSGSVDTIQLNFHLKIHLDTWPPRDHVPTYPKAPYGHMGL
ncbi:hypothetical protein Taro_054073, partial [Colocasia esculenta]|nr:hypothetical protein [Colocasia esculenta]